MSLFQRAHTAKANKVLDVAENPSKILDYLYEQMLGHTTKIPPLGNGPSTAP